MTLHQSKFPPAIHRVFMLALDLLSLPFIRSHLDRLPTLGRLISGGLSLQAPLVRRFCQCERVAQLLSWDSPRRAWAIFSLSVGCRGYDISTDTTAVTSRDGFVPILFGSSWRARALGQLFWIPGRFSRQAKRLACRC